MAFLDALIIASWILLPLMITKAVILLVVAHRHSKKHKPATPLTTGPLVSVLIPAYNEEKVLHNSVESLIAQNYERLEVIIVDDGSTDNTRNLGRLMQSRYPGVVRFFHQTNAGKAAAMNKGLKHSQGDIVCSVDADSVLEADAIGWLAARFVADPNIDAIGGNVKVINRRNILGFHQAVEYIMGLNLQRRTFAYFGAMQVISGAIGSFRRTSLVAIGGFPEETIVEDMDVTVSIGLAGGKVDFESRAIAYTEAPEDIKSWRKQRLRWTFGGFQVCWKHRHRLFKDTPMAKYGLPYFIIFPWIDVAVTTIFIGSVVRAIVTGGVLVFLAIYGVMASFGSLLNLQALRYDNCGERKRLALSAFLESIWYAHIINLVTVVAAFNFIRGANVKWDKLERLGLNTLPVDGKVLAQGGNADRERVAV